MTSARHTAQPARSAAFEFLTGGGEMGKLIAGRDWSKTPLGPIESWPQSLRTTVSLCLASNFPISLAWGPSRTQIYNDGYWPICGAKHPHSMGQDFRECWASAWPVIGEAFETAEKGEARFLENQRMFLDRNGYLEETFFTFSFSPIRDETGGVGGLFHPVTETTVRMLSERRTRALRDLASRTAKAGSVEEACAEASEVLAGYVLDLPFVLLYVMDELREELELLGSTGIEADSAAAPARIRLDQPDSAWPLKQVLDTAQPQIAEHFAERLGLSSCGPYDDLPTRAFVLPISRPGLNRQAGVLVAGVSARLPLDEAYRSFYDLLTGQLATALANARAYGEERRRAEALAELDRAKTQFFSNVSHEFRTPLTLMLGPLEELLAPATPTVTARRDELDLVYRNGLRLLRLVNALLDFSRIEAGRAQASFQPVDLAGYTTDLASLFRSATEKAGLRFVVDCPPLSQPVYVDRSMWEKVVLNLVSNAFKFTLEGEIRVTLREHPDRVELAVSDTGTGIPAAALPRLFERFYRVEGAVGRTYEGTGIGLSLVQELVKVQGGEVKVESEWGAGSTFRVFVPLSSAHLPADQVSLPPPGSPALPGVTRSFVEEALRWIPDNKPDSSLEAPGTRAASGSARARILLADDNADMRQYVEHLLVDDYEVESVTNGAEALRAARARRPDLVLSDVMMPELDGFGLLAALRQGEDTRSVPIILLSARAGEEARVEGLEAGADDYLVKPFGARELLARVRINVELAQLRDQLSREEESRRSMAAIERQFRLFDTALSHTLDFTYLFDLEGRFTYVNRALLSLWQKPLEEALGRNFYDLDYPPELADRLQSQIQQVIDTREPLRDNVPFAGPTGETRFYEHIFVPVFTPDGRVEAVAGSTRDITEQRQAEQAMRDSEQRLARALEAGQLGAWELDLVTHRAWRSLQHDQIFGYPTLLPEWTYPMFLEHVAAEQRAEVDQLFQTAVASGGEWAFECRIHRVDGLERWIWVQGRVESNAEGKPVRMKGMVRDISERRRAEDELRRSNEELARTNRELEEFAFVSSHDLQEPLRMVNIYSQLILRRLGTENPDLNEYAGFVRQGVVRMETLLSDLLTFSRTVQREQLPGDIADLSAALSEARSVLLDRTAETGALITAQPLPLVRGDTEQLAHVFQNLLSNALKYRREDVTPEIHITAERDGAHWLVAVQDNGIGFEQQYAEKIFGLFKRLHKGAYPGTGLGLAICQRIVERYGGRIWAEGRPGKGATFFFTLPSAEEA